MRKIMLLALCLTLVVGVSSAWATTTINIDDSTEGTVQVTSNNFTVTQDAAEIMRGSGSLPQPYYFGSSQSWTVVLTEGPGGASAPKSDFLNFTANSSSTTFNIWFESDGYATFATDLANLSGTLYYAAETGDWQGIPGIAGKSWDNILEINVKSDVAPSAVPVPASVLLLGSGLLGLVGFGWRKRG
ncbi:MAG: PEP-CTERM sorting domain-containing protein [Desulfobaccales bacterium]